MKSEPIGSGGPWSTGYGPHCALTESFVPASAKLMDSD